MRIFNPSRLFGILAVLLPATAAQAEVRLPHIFGSHMVLQQEKPVVIWGWANPGEAVTADLGTASAKATANDRGEWKLALPPQKAGGAAMTLTITASNKVVFDDVLIGEVWLCSGQSNMEFGVGRVANAPQEIADADQPDIRLMKVEKSWKPAPQSDMTGTWKVCTPKTVTEGGWDGFSAVGYFFGKNLHKQLGVPIGLIDCTWGGTKIESWTAPEGFAAVPALARENQALQLAVPGNPEHDRLLNKAIDDTQEWVIHARDALTDHEQPPSPPAFPTALLGPTNLQGATALFNGMIHPVCPFAMRGAIWYQGEANHDEGKLYTERMKALIGGWRTIWGEGDFPFYYVQIAPYSYGDPNPATLPEFWEAQAAAESIRNTGMIVVNDIGNLHDIHPTNKQEVGRRLAVRALADTYGKTDVVGSSPTFKSMKAEGSTLRVTFDHAGTGLISRDGKPPTWFEIADADTGGFKPATAVIDGSSVLLTNPDVKNPIAVRFAWNGLAEPNLSNSNNLPASAFRAGAIPFRESVDKNVPEIKDLTLVYQLDLSKLGHDIRYDVDNHAAITRPFDRIAYAVELQTADGDTKWVYTSMDAFTTDPARIGIPTAGSGAHFQQNVAHLNVCSNVPGITNATDQPGGNIEFWPNNYRPENSAKVPGASDTTFDFGDEPTNPVDGYGCMQVHNHAAGQTLWAVNDWREGNNADIGLGNAPGGNPDWTFAKNASGYPAKRLRVYVREKK
jgi:sialate O-acetylesterase